MLFLKYLWNTSKHELTKVLWNMNEIWSVTWAFLVCIWPYSMRVMYLLDLVEPLLDNTHDAKLQAFTKKYSVAIYILLLLFYCYYYYYHIFFKSKKDKLYYLHYWIDWYGWSLLKDDKSSHEALVIQSNQRLTWICQISQHTAKKITKWIIVTRTLDITINQKLYRDFNFWRQQHVFLPKKLLW